MKISDQQFRRLLARYLDNTASPHERELLDRFFNSYSDEIPDRELLNNAKLQEKILQGIHARVATQRRPAMGGMHRIWIALAAVVSLFVLAYFWATETKPAGTVPIAYGVVEKVSPRGQRTVIRLPDGTTVHLNSESKISYPENFGLKIREVEVSGEAYFEVVKNEKPFVVHAGKVRTEVLGTSFNIKNRTGKRIEVTLAEGKLNVTTSSGNSSLLRPLQQAVIKTNTGELLTRHVDVRLFTSWKDNVLLFEKTSLKDAISVLESWYAVEIDIVNPTLEQCSITGKYKDEPLGNVLSSFQFLLKLDIRRLNETHYAIRGTGCK